MVRTACVIAAAVVISAAAYGTSRATPIAPLAGVAQLGTDNDVTQVWYYHHLVVAPERPDTVRVFREL